MHCKKCGKENENDARYCEYCGAPLDNGDIRSEVVEESNDAKWDQGYENDYAYNSDYSNGYPDQYGTAAVKKKPVKAMIVILIIVIAAGCAAGGCFAYRHFTKETVNVAKAANLESEKNLATGYDGDGTFENGQKLPLDSRDKLKHKISKKLKGEKRREWNRFVDNLTLSCDETEGIRNGQKLKVEIESGLTNPDLRELQRHLNVSITGLNESIDYTVTNLDEENDYAASSSLSGDTRSADDLDSDRYGSADDIDSDKISRAEYLAENCVANSNTRPEPTSGCIKAVFAITNNEYDTSKDQNTDDLCFLFRTSKKGVYYVVSVPDIRPSTEPGNPSPYYEGQKKKYASEDAAKKAFEKSDTNHYMEPVDL